MSQHGLLVAAGMALALVAATGREVARAEEGVDLSGTWVLNAEESDDLQGAFRHWLQARGASGARGGGGGARTPGTGTGDSSGGFDAAGGGGGFGRGAGGGLMAMMRRFSQGMEKLTIVQNDPEVTITNAAGASNLVYTDGRVIERVDDNGGKTKVKTRWKKGRMIVDIDFPARPNPAGGMLQPGFTMTYSLDKKGRLELASRVTLGGTVPPFTVDRVYDREPVASQ